MNTKCIHCGAATARTFGGTFANSFYACDEDCARDFTYSAIDRHMLTEARRGAVSA